MDDKGDKIRCTIMMNDYEKGGFQMIDIKSYNKSLKTTWVKKYVDDENSGKWKLFFERELWKYGGKLLFRRNLNRRDTALNSGAFRCMGWSQLYTSQINTKQQLFEQPLWHNSLIRSDNKPVFLNLLSSKGIFKIKHLTKYQNIVFSVGDLSTTFKIQIQPLSLLGVISSIRSISVLGSVTEYDGADYEDFSSLS